MKIFFCETFDDGTVGGSHACMYNLIRHLDRSKISCTVGFLGENVYVRKFRELGVPVVLLPIRNPLKSAPFVLRKAVNWYRLEYQAGKYLEDVFRKLNFDLVVLNNSIHASHLFVRVCKQANIPVAVYERGIGCLNKKDIRATADIHVSIAVSDAVLRFIQDKQFRTKKIVKIYDGIDPDAIKPARAPGEVKATLNIPAQSRVIGMVGNIKFWKGQKYFIEGVGKLARRYDDIYGVLVGGWGDADREYLRELRHMVDAAGLNGRILFLGHRMDVPDLLSIFDVFVHASIRPEPFGMVILEAMAAQRPIVASSIGGPVEILNSGECGILATPEDGGAIAGACRAYFENPSLAREKVEKATKRLHEHFHIFRTRDQVTQLFEHIVSLKQPRPEPYQGTCMSETERGTEI